MTATVDRNIIPSLDLGLRSKLHWLGGPEKGRGFARESPLEGGKPVSHVKSPQSFRQVPEHCLRAGDLVDSNVNGTQPVRQAV